MTGWLRRPLLWVPITVALLGFVLWRSRPWESGRLGSVDGWPLAAAVALNGLVLVLWAVRSADLLAAAGRPVPIRPLVPMTALANTINNLTPGSVGELLRLYLLRQRHGVPYITAAAVILIERIVAIFFLAGSAALAWAASRAWISAPVAVLGLLAIAVLPALSYALGVRPSAIVTALPLGLAVGRRRWLRASETLERIDDSIGGLLTEPRHMIVFGGTTAFILVVYTTQLLLVAQAVGVSLEPVAGWGALGLSITVGVISFLPFGLGATDVVLAALLGGLGVEAPLAAAIILGYRLTATVPLAVAGSVSYAYLSATLPAGSPADAMREASAALGLPDPDRTP
jgi:uncharacterized protein (TIRG00374 family)